MSEPRKLEPHEAFDVLERIVMRDEAERIAGLDDAGLARELAATGRTLEGERAKGQALIERLKARQTPAVAVAVPAHSETRTTSGFRLRAGSRARRPTLVWLLSASLAMVGAIGFLERHAIVARFAPQPVPIEPLPSGETAPTPSPQEAALDLRHEARTACEAMNLDLCERQLDDAKKLDPAGENYPAVRSLRTFLHMKRLPPPSKDDPFGKGVTPKAPKGQ
jgi:hypothetical protein